MIEGVDFILQSRYCAPVPSWSGFSTSVPRFAGPAGI